MVTGNDRGRRWIEEIGLGLLTLLKEQIRTHPEAIGENPNVRLA